jgi:hypothetical protein
MVILTEHQIRAALSAGRHVEQFLQPRTGDGYTVIRWLDLFASDKGYGLTLYEVFDDGCPDWLDVYGFSAVTPDDEPPQHLFLSLDEALAFAVTTYNAPRNNYVSEGLIQDEYANYLRTAGRV